MFTGIIENTGKVQSLTEDRLIVESASALVGELKIGSSIAVDGACLTVVEKNETTFTVDFMPETAKKTVVLGYNNGDAVNLELPMKADGRFEGHMVTGHVETTGEVTAIKPSGNSQVLSVKIATELQKYVIRKGSVTINGISLTVAEIEGDEIAVHIIPHTWEHTNLHNLQVGGKVNVETDVLGKYIEKLQTSN